MTTSSTFGINPLGYEGIDLNSVANVLTLANRIPTVLDVQPPGTIWPYDTTPLTLYMSQGAGNWIILASTVAPLYKLTADTGFAVPSIGNINILGDGVSISTSASGNTFVIKLMETIKGTVTTVGAQTVTILTIPLGATPGSYLFKVDIMGYDSINDVGVSYYLTGGAKTDGSVAAELQNETADEFEDPSLSTCDNDLAVSGNNALINLTGAAGHTISWTAVAIYSFGS